MNYGRESVMLALIKSLAINSYIKEIDLSGNFRIRTKEKETGVSCLQALAGVVENHASLIGLGMEGAGINVLGRSLAPLFMALGENSKLQKVSVRGHLFGDAGAKDLFDMLRWNKSLRKIDYDNNNLTPAGWSFALRCLNANRTLVDVEYPKADIAKFLKKFRTREPFRGTRFDFLDFLENRRVYPAQCRGGV